MLDNITNLIDNVFKFHSENTSYHLQDIAVFFCRKLGSERTNRRGVVHDRWKKHFPFILQ